MVKIGQKLVNVVFECPLNLIEQLVSYQKSLKMIIILTSPEIPKNIPISLKVNASLVVVFYFYMFILFLYKLSSQTEEYVLVQSKSYHFPGFALPPK